MKSTAGYNIKILVSDGKNDKVNALEPATMKSNENSKVIAHSTTTQKQAITHEEERAALILFFHWTLYYVVYVSMNKIVSR